jgi:hypothetical protein
MFCPRGAYAFWREAWLKRAGTPADEKAAP